MLILITYDVSTESDGGKKRLRKVSKCCQNYGQRVQNSVFECNVDNLTLKKLQVEIKSIIDDTKDSIRYYNLGNSYKSKVTHIGTKPSFDVTDTIIV